MNSPIVTASELRRPRPRSPIAVGFVVGVTTFILTWAVLAWPTIVLNLKWASGIPLNPAVEDARGAEVPVVEANHLAIPRVGVSAPIFFDVETDDAVGQLPDGVVHVRGTARPGQIGTSFIVGHSAGYWWQRGDYNQVFALLDKLEVGDQLFVNVDGNQSVFAVTGRRIIHPSQIDVLTQSTDESLLTLMTCTPVGTTLNRLLVEARLVTMPQ